MHEPGTLSRGEDGQICIRAEDEHYYIPVEDVRSLLLTGKATPVLATRRVSRGGGLAVIEGYAVLGSGRRSVFIYSRAGHFITPVVNFLRVARGEAESAPLFPLIPGDAGAGP
jgi:hypothetical protein